MPEDRFERLANLVTYLLAAGERGHPGATYAEIVSTIPGYPEGAETRRRAFERDKRLLRDEDIPLVEIDGRYRIPPEEYYLPDLGLTEPEQLALQLAVAAVPLGDGGDAGGAALQKLTVGGELGEGVPGRLEAGAVADLDEHPLLPVLHSAIRQRATVTFTYGSGESGTSRTVEPAMLFFREGHWYLFGFDLLRQSERNFRVDRIEGGGGGVTVGTAGGFERRVEKSSAAAMPKQPWLLGGADTEQASAVVKVDAVLAEKAVADAGPSATVEWQGDRSVILTMAVVHTGAFRSWVLGMVDHAEVVGPPELRDDLVHWLQSIAR